MRNLAEDLGGRPDGPLPARRQQGRPPRRHDRRRFRRDVPPCHPRRLEGGAAQAGDLRTHGAATPSVGDRSHGVALHPGPASAEHHNATMGCLREAGFPFREAVHAYNLLDSYTYGFALQEKTIPFETSGRVRRDGTSHGRRAGGLSIRTWRRSLRSSATRGVTTTRKSSSSAWSSSSTDSATRFVIVCAHGDRRVPYCRRRSLTLRSSAVFTKTWRSIPRSCAVDPARPCDSSSAE